MLVWRVGLDNDDERCFVFKKYYFKHALCSESEVSQLTLIHRIRIALTIAMSICGKNHLALYLILKQHISSYQFE